MELHNPFGISMGHYITLFPKKCRVRSFDLQVAEGEKKNGSTRVGFAGNCDNYHFKFAQKFHGVHFFR